MFCEWCPSNSGVSPKILLSSHVCCQVLGYNSMSRVYFQALSSVWSPVYYTRYASFWVDFRATQWPTPMWSSTKLFSVNLWSWRVTWIKESCQLMGHSCRRWVIFYSCTSATWKKPMTWQSTGWRRNHRMAGDRQNLGWNFGRSQEHTYEHATWF